MNDSWLEDIEKHRRASQMFDPPFSGSIAVAGRPVLRIPNSDKKYPSFLAWWMEVGRLKPRDPQGWRTLSEPGVMRNRTEAIEPETWAKLPEEEQKLIGRWPQTWPIGIFFD